MDASHSGQASAQNLPCPFFSCCSPILLPHSTLLPQPQVISSGPNDRVFVFYSDHGSPGVLGMPTGALLAVVCFGHPCSSMRTSLDCP